MFGDGFEGGDTGHVEFNVFGFPHGVGILARDGAQIGHRVAGMGFDLEPDAEFRFRRPDGNHIGTGVAGDHARTFLGQGMGQGRHRLTWG